MKKTSSARPHHSDKAPPDVAPRKASDNLCKRLAEEYPAQFAQWLFGAAGKVKVHKTELSREPIRADAVIFSRAESETLHAEFQASMTRAGKSAVPVPLRMLDYYVGLKRRHPLRRVRQVLVVLKPTDTEVPGHYEDERTRHEYDVIRMWEQDPAALLAHEGLLPLATLCRAESAAELLGTVAAQIKGIASRAQRREVLNWSRVLAGLRYNKTLIYQTLKESDMLEESVVYQDIFRKGRRSGVKEGLKEGLAEGERKLALRLLEKRFGKLSASLRQKIDQLVSEQVEALGEALLDFKTKQDLASWLAQSAPTRRSRA